MGKVKLGDIAVLINGDRGKNYPSQKEIITSGGIPFVNAGHLNGRAIEFEAMNYITPEKYEKLNSGKFQQNDILYCLRGSLGKKALINDNIYGAIASSLVIIRPNLEKVRPQYLMLALETPLIKEQLFKFNNGSSQPNLSAKSVKEYKLELPDLFIQDSIISKLEKVRNLIEDEKQEKLLLDNLIQARFVEMFGDPIKNPKKYPIHQLSEHITSLTSGSRGWAQYCVNDGREWFITIKNVKDCHIITDNMQPVNAPDNAEAKRTKVQEGDLLISITADLGRTGVVTKEIAEHGAYINQHLSCIRVNKEVLNPLFVAHYMESPAGKEQFTAKNQSAVKAGLNFNAINSLKLIVPPMKEQKNFINFVNQVDKLKVKVQKALDETQKLFDSLMQQYFG